MPQSIRPAHLPKKQSRLTETAREAFQRKKDVVTLSLYAVVCYTRILHKSSIPQQKIRVDNQTRFRYQIGYWFPLTDASMKKTGYLFGTCIKNCSAPIQHIPDDDICNFAFNWLPNISYRSHDLGPQL
jgi:hypothetical protein